MSSLALNPPLVFLTFVTAVEISLKKRDRLCEVRLSSMVLRERGDEAVLCEPMIAS